MKKIYTLIFLLLGATAYGQLQPAMVSLQGIGGNGVDQIGSFVTKTDDGFIVGIGSNSTAGTGNLDFYCSNNGDKTIYLKYNNSGALQWSKCLAPGGFIFPLSNGDFIYGTLTDPLTGWAFVVGREDATGDVIWSKTYGNNADAILRSMIATDDGGYIMMGETNYTDTDVLLHYGSFMDADIWVLKVDSSGNKIWSTVIGGSSDEGASTIVEIPGSGFYITGATSSNDHDCIGNHGGYDVYLARLDNNGNIIWHRDLGGTASEGTFHACADNKGGIIIAANTFSTNGDVTDPIGGENIWALNIDSSNNIIWNSCYGGGGGDCFPNAICKATDGSIWIAGVVSQAYGEIQTNYGRDDAWFVHTDSSGNFLSAKVLGSAEQDYGQMVYPLLGGAVIAGGYYGKNDGQFISLNSYGEFPTVDAFITEFAPWTTNVQSSLISDKKVKLYPNPAIDYVTIETKQYGNYDIEVSDITGRKIYEASFTDNIQIPISHWQSGMYYIQVTKNNGYRDIQKLIVQ